MIALTLHMNIRCDVASLIFLEFFEAQKVYKVHICLYCLLVPVWGNLVRAPKALRLPG